MCIHNERAGFIRSEMRGRSLLFPLLSLLFCLLPSSKYRALGWCGWDPPPQSFPQRVITTSSRVGWPPRMLVLTREQDSGGGFGWLGWLSLWDCVGLEFVLVAKQDLMVELRGGFTDLVPRLRLFLMLHSIFLSPVTWRMTLRDKSDPAFRGKIKPWGVLTLHLDWIDDRRIPALFILASYHYDQGFLSLQQEQNSSNSSN